MYVCAHFCIFAYISLYSHLSSKDVPHDLLQNERLESFCHGLWLGIQFVFGVNIETFDKQLMINDEIFILDGHHRFQYIIENSIDDLFEVVFVDINDIKIESYNSELLISDDSFLQKISKEKGFSVSNNSKYFISLNKIKYYSEDISDINELYSFKKELLEDLIILPIRNDDNTKKSLVNFTPLTAQNFNKNKVFPYKSTWITPRFDV